MPEKVDGGGHSQVTSHSKCHKEGAEESASRQRSFTTSSEGCMSLSNKEIKLCKEDLVLNAEILQALHVVDCSQPFASTNTDSDRFKSMFPDSIIAKSYGMAKTKVKYTIELGIAPYLKEKLINMLPGVPFTFKFDETTTCQVKKQYDAYIQF